MLESVESILYEIVPALRYLPASPGKSSAKALGKSSIDFYKDCLTSLKRHMSQAEESGENVAYWGLIATILGNQGNEEASTIMATEGKPDIRWTENALLGLAQATTDAATDTTISTASSFILALAVNQDILHKVQAEIDQMCGRDQKTEPEYSDISKLPYLKACVLEVGPSYFTFHHRGRMTDRLSHLGRHFAGGLPVHSYCPIVWTKTTFSMAITYPSIA